MKVNSLCHPLEHFDRYLQFVKQRLGLIATQAEKEAHIRKMAAEMRIRLLG